MNFEDMTIAEIFAAYVTEENREQTQPIIDMEIATLSRNEIPLDVPVRDMTAAQTEKLAALNRGIEAMISLLT